MKVWEVASGGVDVCVPLSRILRHERCCDPNTLYVYSFLADWSANHGGRVDLSVRDAHEQVGLTPAKYRRCIEELERHGLIQRVRVPRSMKGGKGHPGGSVVVVDLDQMLVKSVAPVCAGVSDHE